MHCKSLETFVLGGREWSVEKQASLLLGLEAWQCHLQSDTLCKWPETFQSSWLLCNNNTCRVAAGTRHHPPPECGDSWGTTPPGTGFAQRPAFSRSPPRSTGGGNWTDQRDQFIFREWQMACRWLGESTYLPWAQAPLLTTCRENLFRSDLYEEVSRGNRI